MQMTLFFIGKIKIQNLESNLNNFRLQKKKLKKVIDFMNVYLNVNTEPLVGF